MKKYWHDESVFTLYDENMRLFGIIGYSQIAHENSPDIKFVRFQAYYKPLWAGDFKLLATGDLRWDGYITGTFSPLLCLRGRDDLLSRLLVEFSIYDIAYNEIYLTYISDKYQQVKTYDKMTDLVDVSITYRNVYEKEDMLSEKHQKFCDNLKNKLTEMSSKVIADMEEKREKHAT